MAKIAKRVKAWQDTLQPGKQYTVEQAVDMVKQYATAKFRESVDVSINLGIDAKKSDQTVRGSTVLPHGTGKTMRVAVFAQGKNAEAATAAGADVVGFEDLATKIQGGDLNFDVVIATPDAMRVVGKLGTVLGPRGLMPNPKVGTVTADVTTAVKNAKGGQVRFRADKAGVVQCSIGKADFDKKALLDNLQVLLAEVRKVKPANAKGIYLKKLTLSTTMGPGVIVDQSSLGE
jgi:large subunit ribosomal protein L1